MEPARAGRRRRVLRWGLGALGMFVLALALVTWRWTLSPASTPVSDAGPTDAVVMFVGGRGERLDTALALMDLGIAQALVIPNGAALTWPQANRLCDGDRPFEIHCPRPDPNNTRGEARAIAMLAADQGWDDLTMVTSTYHLSRAELLLTRCFAGSVTAVAAEPTLSRREWVPRIVHEWLGHVEARIVRRGC